MYYQLYGEQINLELLRFVYCFKGVFESSVLDFMVVCVLNVCVLGYTSSSCLISLISAGLGGGAGLVGDGGGVHLRFSATVTSKLLDRGVA